jgi:opacity protein-like surface antigen
MIRKFAAAPCGHKPERYRFSVALIVAILGTLLAGKATVVAQENQGQAQPTQGQQNPAQAAQSQPDQAQQGQTSQGQAQDSSQQTQQPSAQPSSPQSSAGQQSSSQEASPEESVHRVKPKNYKNWNFNVGGGANAVTGTTHKYVRDGGGVGAAGVTRNLSQYFGFRADFQFDNLPLRQSALQQAQAPGASSQVYALMVDALFNIPASRDWSGYFIIGPGFLHRSGKLDSSTAFPGASCDGFFVWWGPCQAGGLPLDQDFLKENQNEAAINFGAGIAHKVHDNLEIYAEFRIIHGTHDSRTTDVRPITVGVRW